MNKYVYSCILFHLQFNVRKTIKHKADTDSPYAAIGTVSGSLQNSGENEGQASSNRKQYFAAFAGLLV